jgi:trehalose-6-phosphate synthase
MPLEERRQRHAELLERLRKNDIAAWISQFLGALGRVPLSPAS